MCVMFSVNCVSKLLCNSDAFKLKTLEVFNLKTSIFLHKPYEYLKPPNYIKLPWDAELPT